jgi:hypothetical protein
MTKKDFFRIIIKLFGLYWLVTTLFTTFPGYISMIMMNITAMQIIEVSIYVVIIILFFIFLVYKSDLVISCLKLDKGFDEDKIEFQNFGTDNILKLGLIIIGGILIISNIPNFLTQSFFAFKLYVVNSSDVVTLGQQSYYRWAINFLNLLVGYLMLTNYPALSKFLVKITQKKED